MFLLVLALVEVINAKKFGEGITLSQLNITASNRLNQSHGMHFEGMYSPFSLFEKNYKNLYYTSLVRIAGAGVVSEYHVCVDINLPFTFITAKENGKLEYVKVKPNQQQLDYIKLYLGRKFKQIHQYIDDVYFVIESSFSLNNRLTFDYSFFYLTGAGAQIFQIQMGFEGYIGVGLSQSQLYPELNMIVSLYEQNLLQQLTFSTYFGNDPGYIDSVLYLGNYQKIFIDQGNITAVQTLSNDKHPWCLNISNVTVKVGHKAPSYWAKDQQVACLDSTLPFISLNNETMQATMDQLQQDGSLSCDYATYDYQNRYYRILECSSKLPLFELEKYPIISLNISLTNSTHMMAHLNPENYIYSCWYDVTHYLKKCLTLLSLHQNTTDEDFILGLPFLRSYYSYYDIDYQQLYIAQSFEFTLIPQYSTFWYYTLLALLFFWSIVMITCGVYYKEQMNSMMVFVSNIIKYVLGDQEARRQLIMGQIMDDPQ